MNRNKWRVKKVDDRWCAFEPNSDFPKAFLRLATQRQAFGWAMFYADFDGKYVPDGTKMMTSWPKLSTTAISWECPICHREITDQTYEETVEHNGYVMHLECRDDAKAGIK